MFSSMVDTLGVCCRHIMNSLGIESMTLAMPDYAVLFEL